MRAFSCCVLFALTVLATPSQAQPAPPAPVAPKPSPLVADIRRWLHATQWGEIFQGGVRRELGERVKDNPVAQRLLAAPPAEIESVVAPIFAMWLSQPEARAMADFYESSTGQRINAQQAAQLAEPDPAVRLTVPQRLEYERFAAGVGGQGVRRILGNSTLRDQYIPALLQHFQR